MFLITAFNADWFIHQVVSAIVHSAIYGVAYHVFKGLSLPAAIAAGVAMLVTGFFVLKFFGKK